MRTDAYIKRLAADLDQWVREGLIDEATAKQLRAHAGAQAHERSSSPILTSLAGLVIGLGVLTIIAANWSALTGVMRLGLVGALISAAMLSAGYLRDRALDLPSNILAAIAVLLAGGGVIVIGQLYHSSATNAAFFSLWTGLGLLIALTQRSPLAAAGTGLLALAWSLFHVGEAEALTRLPEPLWALPVLAVLGLQGVRWRSLLVINIVALTAIVWISWNVTELVLDQFSASTDGRVAYALFALWAVVALMAEARARLRPAFAIRTLAGWASWAAMAFLLMGLATERVLDSGYMVVIALASLAVFSAVTGYGAAPGRRWFRGAGVVGFVGAAIILFTYSTNLVTAGFILIVFGAALTALLLVTRRRQAKTGEAAS